LEKYAFFSFIKKIMLGGVNAATLPKTKEQRLF
jgi:hypothetical protein